MTVFVILVSLILLAWLALREWLIVAQAIIRLALRPRRKTPAPRINVQAVLDVAARVPTSAAAVPTPILVPPLESADPLWDRELDGGRA